MSQNQPNHPTQASEDTTVSRTDLRMTVYAALFTALIIIGGYVSIPIPVGPVPIVLADFFVMAAGLFLGVKWGLTSVALYLCLGALGLPVFSSGTSGLAILFGPTGGYLIGYLLVVAAVGLITGKGQPSTARILLALVAGNILLYAAGVPWLKAVMNLSWVGALVAGLTPFIPGIIIKIAVVSALGRLLLPRFKQTLASASLQ
ncbi:MAG TPA: biotin transporter BioY [Anaerolineaceae bacterium]|nr:biotin transporter BioY [Anaerolineaceae bacterium]